MKYKVIVKFIIIWVIVLASINLNNCTYASTNYINDSLLQFELQVDGKTKDCKGIIYKYNTIFVPMYETLNILHEKFEGSRLLTEEELNNWLTEKFTYLGYYEKKEEGNGLKSVPTISKVTIKDDKIILPVKDYLLKEEGVEIEKVNGIKYIPIYLLSNFITGTVEKEDGTNEYYGMVVEVNGTKVYEADTEKRCKDVISSSGKYTVNILTNNQTKDVERLTLNNTVQNNESSEIDKNSLAYLGAQNGAVWREEALKRIEKIRKKEVSIKLVDENGNPIDTATLDLKLENTEFIHGLNITNEKKKDNGVYTWENYYDYKKNGKVETQLFNKNASQYSKYSHLFNEIGGLEQLKWLKLALQGKDTNQTTGNSKNKAAINDLLDKARKYNLYFRGHYLWWDVFYTAGSEDPEQQYDNVKIQSLIGDKDNIEMLTAGGNKTMAYIYAKKDELTDAEKTTLIDNLIQEFEGIVLKHISLMVQTYPEINEWDCVNELGWNSFFKHYLYDRGCLADDGFLKNSESIYSNNTKRPGLAYTEGKDTYTQNNDYLKFIAKCFITAKNANPNAKFVLNHNELGISNREKQGLIIDAIKGIKENNNNVQPIDAIGIQHTIHTFSDSGKTLYLSPMVINNNINYIARETEIKNIAITEYWLINDKNSKNNEEIRGKYTYDILISSYSNPNIYEFIYYNYLTSTILQEKEAYEKFANEYYCYDETKLNYDKDKGGIKRNLTKGTYVATVHINGKNEEIEFEVTDGTDEIELKIDKAAPELQVSYSPTKINGNVEVTIKSNEKIQEIEGWERSKDRTILTKTYTENTGEKIEVYDIAGNSSQAEIKVENIDKQKPKVEVEYSTKEKTSKDVIVTIEAKEEIQEIEGWTLSEDKTKLTKTYTSNADETIEIKDSDKNILTATIDINNIDKQKPKVEVEYSTKEKTSKDVIVTIKANEEIQGIEGWKLSEDKKILTKTYTGNSEETINVYDIAGNSSQAEIKVANIDKQKPEVEVEYSSKILTADGVIVTIEANEEIQGVEGWKLSDDKIKLSKTYTQSCEETITIYDLAGNSTNVSIKILEKLKIELKGYNENTETGRTYIENIEPGTTLEEFSSKINTNGRMQILKDNKEVTNNEIKISTGMKVKISLNNETIEYTVTVKGDTNGDGECDLKDLLQINKHRLNKVQLEDEYLLAGDVNKDNVVNIKDILQMNKFRLGKIDSL